MVAVNKGRNINNIRETEEDKGGGKSGKETRSQHCPLGVLESWRKRERIALAHHDHVIPVTLLDAEDKGVAG